MQHGVRPREDCFPGTGTAGCPNSNSFLLPRSPPCERFCSRKAKASPFSLPLPVTEAKQAALINPPHGTTQQGRNEFYFSGPRADFPCKACGAEPAAGCSHFKAVVQHSTTVHGNFKHVVGPYFSKIPMRTVNSRLYTGLKYHLKGLTERGALLYSQASGLC